MGLGGGGGGSSGGSSGPKVYKKQRPEEQFSMDASTGIINDLLGKMGYTMNKTGGRLSEIDAEIARLRGGGGTTGGSIGGIPGLEGIPAGENGSIQGGFPTQTSTVSRDQIKAQIQAAKKEGNKDLVKSLTEQLRGAIGTEDGKGGLGADVEAQIKALEKERKQLTKSGEGQDGYTFDKLPPSADDLARDEFEGKLTDYSRTTLEEGLQGKIPTAVQEQLDTIYGEQDRVGRERLLSMATEAAGARGMNLSDTPIGQPLLREYGNLQAQLGASKAGNLLTARSDEIARAQALREYQDSLGQLRNFTNPQNLLTQTTNLGLGLYAPRFRVSAGGTPVTGGGMMGGISSILGGLGNFSNSNLGQSIGGWLSNNNVFGNSPGGEVAPSIANWATEDGSGGWLHM